MLQISGVFIALTCFYLCRAGKVEAAEEFIKDTHEI